MLDDDLRELILACLEIEKKYVCEDRDNYCAATAIIVCPEGRMIMHPEFNDEESKTAAYEEVVRVAREKIAIAIVTVNSATTSQDSLIGDDLGGYWWGKIAADGGCDCILITASGPNMQSYQLTVAYEVTPNDVRFDSHARIEVGRVNFLRGWAEENPTPAS